MITITIFHNVARDGQGRPAGMLDGYQPGDPVIRVFTYQADPAGRDPEQIAEEAFEIYAGPDLVHAKAITHGDHKMAGGVH